MACPQTFAELLLAACITTLGVSCSHGGVAPASPSSSSSEAHGEASEADSRVATKDGPPRVQRIEEGDSQTEALPEGPCQKSVDCKETEVAMNPHFVFHGRKVCFWDPEARCACAKQLGVDDKAFCERGHY